MHTLYNKRTPNSILGNRLLLFNILVFSILILVRDVSGVAVPKAVFIAMATILFVFSKESETYSFLAFLAPLSTGMPLTYIAAIALLILLLKQRRVAVDTIGLVCFLGILFIELLSSFGGLFSFVQYLRFIGLFGIVMLFVFGNGTEVDYEVNLKLFLLGSFIAILSIWGQMLNEYSIGQILSLDIRFGNTRRVLNVVEESMLITFNQNGLGSLCNLSLFTALLLYKKSSNAIYLAAAILFAVQGVMTGSRTFVLVLLFGILMFGLFSATSWKSFLRTLLIILLCAVVILLLLNNYFGGYLESLLLRFTAEDITNGRVDITNEYFQAWISSPNYFFFGSGLQNYQTKYGMVMSAHVSLEEVLVTWGIVGLFLFIVMSIRMIIKAKRMNPGFQLILCIPYFCYLLSSLAGQGFSSTSFIAYTLLCFSAMNFKIINKKQESV